MQDKQKFLEKSGRNTNKESEDLIQKKLKILHGAGEDVNEIIEVAKLQKTDLKKLKYIETVKKYYADISINLNPDYILYDFYLEFTPKLISELNKLKSSILSEISKSVPEKISNNENKSEPDTSELKKLIEICKADPVKSNIIKLIPYKSDLKEINREYNKKDNIPENLYYFLSKILTKGKLKPETIRVYLSNKT